MTSIRRAPAYVPWLLMISRGVAGVAAPGIALTCTHAGPVLAVLVVAAVLSDIFDGIVARRLGVATARLRRLDSIVDLVFWLGAASCLWIVRPDLMSGRSWIASAIVGGEALTYALSLARYRCVHSTHAYSAKAFGLVISVVFVAIFGFGAGVWTLYLLLVAYVLSLLDVIAIILLLKTPPVDVPSCYHALLLRHGKRFRTHWLFHGAPPV